MYVSLLQISTSVLLIMEDVSIPVLIVLALTSVSVEVVSDMTVMANPVLVCQHIYYDNKHIPVYNISTFRY